ncbi:MAG: UPF0149 family protein [Gammaproteobacteria bacterium]|nr:UPF0149 family protein [Gammaproteobacteria bacterium]
MSEFETVEHALSRLHAEMEPPECHGILTGLLLAQGNTDTRQLISILAPQQDPNDLLAKEAAAELNEILESTVTQLGDTSCDFHPLLAADDVGIEIRLHALSEWIQGFLLGLSRGGVEDYAKLPAEAAEFVDDLTEMARATSYELEEDADENEASYMELVEYLRTGILLMNELMHPTMAPPITEKPTLH